MKNIQPIVSLVITGMLLVWAANAGAQQKSSRNTTMRELLAVQKNEKAIAALETKIVNCDQSIDASTVVYEQMNDSINANFDLRKTADKAYWQKQKAISKRTTSKDRQVAKEARAELKALSTEYRAFAKTNDAQFRSYLKTSDAASRNLYSAETTRKLSQQKLKETRKNLGKAQKMLAAKEKLLSEQNGGEYLTKK